MKKEYFKVINPGTFSNSTHATLEDAEKAVVEFGIPIGGKDSKYWDYWQELSKQCKIVKVIESTQELTAPNEWEYAANIWQDRAKCMGYKPGKRTNAMEAEFFLGVTAALDWLSQGDKNRGTSMTPDVFVSVLRGESPSKSILKQKKVVSDQDIC